MEDNVAEADVAEALGAVAPSQQGRAAVFNVVSQVRTTAVHFQTLVDAHGILLGVLL